MIKGLLLRGARYPWPGVRSVAHPAPEFSAIHPLRLRQGVRAAHHRGLRLITEPVMNRTWQRPSVQQLLLRP